MTSQNIGITDISVYVPEEKMQRADLARLSGISEKVILEQTGVNTKGILKKDQNSIDMAEHAVRELLDKNKIDALDIDSIIYCSSGVSNKYLWSPAAKIQNLIGAENAFSFEIVNGCNAGNLGLQTAVNVLKNDQTKNKILIIVCDALSRIVNHTDPNHLSIYNFSDAAAAILIACGEKKNNLLSFYAKTEAQFVDHMHLPAKSNHVVMSDDEAEDRFLSATYIKMYSYVIRTALEKTDFSIQDVKHVFINQGNHQLIGFLEKSLSISENIIHKTYAEYGHMGGADIFFGLHEKQKRNEVAPGDIIVFASSASGFSWSASVLRA